MIKGIVSLLVITLSVVLPTNSTAQKTAEENNSEKGWQSPPQDILDVLNAPKLPWVWTSPTGEYLLLMDPQHYPPLADLAAPMHKLAGIRVNPKVNGYHGNSGGTSPRLVKISDGSTKELGLPKDKEIVGVTWTADGQRFALNVKHSDHIGLWVGSVNGDLKEIKDVALNPLMGRAATWLPDQKRLLIRRIPKRGVAPQEPVIPIGPMIMEGEGASARSTYEARNLLETAYDDALFDYYMTSELVVLDPTSNKTNVLGKPGVYRTASFSPDGKYFLVQRLVGPWSHEVAWWRFGSEIEVWDSKGELVSSIASLPLADAVPVHGVTLGPRSVSWRATAPHTLYWVEALDGGDPASKAKYRDKLMRSEAPFNSDPEEVFKAEHRIQTWSLAWFEGNNTLLLSQRQRIKRRRYTWLIDVDKKSSRLWYEYDEGDRYGAPGYPVYKQMPNGKYVLYEKNGGVYFSGSGGTDKGDRPFLDHRQLESGVTERLFRCNPDRYEFFVDFAGDEEHFVLRSESATDVPNYHLATIGNQVATSKGEASREITTKPITNFKDPTPQLREIEKRIVRYQREDSVPLSFHLHLPPGYKEGTALPTVVYAYPLEYSGASTAGQVRGSAQRFMRIGGPSHLYFLLRGYAVLERTAMPMIGDPETTYNTFVSQLVADAEAAVAKAVDMGVTDPDRIGVIGHSHGGLMVANLLAHTDLFRAGIARSGSYNKTNQPFGFQSERRSLFDAQDVYIQLSPTFFADKVNEPVLIIHGNDDSNPGTLTFQSEVFYEAVRGSGGTARLVLLPYEDHGYRARESVEHVLWEQLRWFDKYVKNAKPKE
ncbi:MAG: peptidase [Crocinitomicaceae bacterium]|nr:peptidase [Crocinitomicaceae bacterium]|tara:strand:- start:704 stop:3172 length:2469 start_codon:yes stop_codon:yes gene_type:complete